jgi:hypothetical protein
MSPARGGEDRGLLRELRMIRQPAVAEPAHRKQRIRPSKVSSSSMGGQEASQPARGRWAGFSASLNRH